MNTDLSIINKMYELINNNTIPLFYGQVRNAWYETFYKKLTKYFLTFSGVQNQQK